MEKEMLQKDIEELKDIKKSLQMDIIELDDKILFQNFGVYQPQYNFATLDEYKDFEDKLMESLDTYTNIMSKPYVTGKDLVEHGLKPDKSFSKVLEYSHKLRLAGVDKDKALKQTIRFAEELSKQGGK